MKNVIEMLSCTAPVLKAILLLRCKSIIRKANEENDTSTIVSMLVKFQHFLNIGTINLEDHDQLISMISDKINCASMLENHTRGLEDRLFRLMLVSETWKDWEYTLSLSQSASKSISALLKANG